MASVSVFLPNRLRGILFHSAAIVLLLSLSIFALISGLEQQIGGYFILFLLLAVLFFVPLPPLFYSAYALLRARYFLERDGLHLRWGLRVEDIPLREVEWVRPADDLPIHLPLPRLSWPGALVGTVKTDELGVIEYLASSRAGLLLVATHSRVFAISPNNPQDFLQAIEKSFEMGSLSPIPAKSVLPAAYVAQVWETRPARILIMSGLILALGLFIAVSLAIPTRPTASLGFSPNGQPLSPGPSAQLILLPILALLFYLVDLAFGMVFFRRPTYRSLAYLMWSSSILTTLVLSSAALIIILL
jgi:hypothetical protein